MHNRCPGHMVLCKITRVISATSSSNGYYTIDKVPIHLKLTVVLVSLFQTNKRNCSRTEQISHHSPTTSASDAKLVQSAPKEELSLDQAVNLGNRESRKFCVIHFGSSIITRILCNSHHFSYFLRIQLRFEIRNWDSLNLRNCINSRVL